MPRAHVGLHMRPVASWVQWGDADQEYVTKDWHGLRAILADVYPGDVFTGASGDVGPRLIALLREIDAVESTAARGPSVPVEETR